MSTLDPGIDPQDVEAVALWMLETLAGKFGVGWLLGIVAVLTGKGDGMQIVEPVSEYLSDVVQSILNRLGEDAVRAKLAAAYAAVDATVDAAAIAKFGKP